MFDFYNFLIGPMALGALVIFFGGSLYKIIKMVYLVKKRESFIFTYMSWKYGLRSILHWIIPFFTVNMRKHPVMTVVSFIFHICVLVTTLFLLSHIVIIDEFFGVKWMNLSDNTADIMIIIVISCCIFFLIRRLVCHEVRFVTTASDYFLLILITMVFITGFIAYHQWFYYRFFHICHILSGEILLIVFPYTRLNHMLFAIFSRFYTGSEFGGVKHAKDW